MIGLSNFIEFYEDNGLFDDILELSVGLGKKIREFLWFYDFFSQKKRHKVT